MDEKVEETQKLNGIIMLNRRGKWKISRVLVDPLII